MPKVKDFELEIFESEDYNPFQKTKHEPKKGKYEEKKDYRKNYVDNSEID